MGGYGSGRPSYKQKVEGSRALDVNRCHRQGILNPGWRGSWIWSQDGNEVARINVKAQQGQLMLDYRVRQGGGDWETVRQPVPVIYTPCHYGGQRPYFRCPGVVNGRHCNRRVAKLYAGGKYFLCRHCYNLAYTSQSEPRYDRMLRRANKLRRALGGEAGTANWIAPKPKGMSQRKYQRKRFEIEWCEGQANHLFIEQFAHLLGKEEWEKYI
ncbi:hypothetical protein [Pseudosulfitobacter sp. SM2401]|uniref:hypothetical protein n=1 Tax=Pseudosulfitobacter sp. SM2401 TaxID=3350098 RepID=UPI0036F219F9